MIINPNDFPPYLIFKCDFCGMLKETRSDFEHPEGRVCMHCNKGTFHRVKRKFNIISRRFDHIKIT